MEHTVTFTGEDINATIKVPTNTLLADAAHMAGIDIGQPCGGQGRCGRCAVQATEGSIRRRSTLRLSPADVEQGYALACQSVVEGDVSIDVPPQEKIERRLTTDRVVAEVTVPVDYEYSKHQTIQRYLVQLTPPSMDDQTDDWSRLQTALRSQYQVESPACSLSLLRKMGKILREGDWKVTAILEKNRLIDLHRAAIKVRPSGLLFMRRRMNLIRHGPYMFQGLRHVLVVRHQRIQGLRNVSHHA